MWNSMHYILFFLFVVIISGCSETQKTQFVTRQCNEIKFECLPEMADPSWQDISQNNGQVESLVINNVVNQKAEKLKYIISLTEQERSQAGITYVPTKKDYDFLHQLSTRDAIIEYEKDIAKLLPGYWGDTPKPIRYRWLRMAIVKAKKYANDDNGPYPWVMIRLCVRIGLRFDMDPKWEPIREYIQSGSHSDYGENISEIIDYIDYSIFDRKTSEFGDQIVPRNLLNIDDPKQELATMK
jgi:hypothetical protein